MARKRKYEYKYKRTIAYNGKRYWIYANSEEELGRKKAEKIASLKDKSEAASNITVADFGDRCIELYKPLQNVRSRECFEGMVRREIYEPIGSYRVRDITAAHCQMLMNGTAGYSTSYINKIYNALRFIFRYAVIEEIILKDPTANLLKPKGTYTPRRALTSMERNAVIELGITDRRYYIFLLELLCGCRPSEAAECTGSDIIVREDNGRIYPLLHIRGTKSQNANRYVPIPDVLFELIKDTPENEYIACTPSGNKIVQNNRQSLWRTFWKELNRRAGCKIYRNKLLEPYPIPRDLTPYCLRHEYCSELARRGIDIRIAQKLMGHSDITLTANIYTHIDNSDLYRVTDILSG